MTGFIAGIDLCRSFFTEVVKPIVDRTVPGLEYAAGLLGSGSEVLGFDTSMSSDHDWGRTIAGMRRASLSRTLTTTGRSCPSVSPTARSDTRFGSCHRGHLSRLPRVRVGRRDRRGRLAHVCRAKASYDFARTNSTTTALGWSASAPSSATTLTMSRSTHVDAAPHWSVDRRHVA